MSNSKANAPDPLEGAPAWARKLAERYFTQTVSTFLLHGAVRDLQPVRRPEGLAFLPLREFLGEELFGGRDHVVTYDRSAGIRGYSRETQADLQRTFTAYDTLYGTDFARSTPREPGKALQLVENYLRTRVADGKSVALVIDFAEALAPAGEMGGLSGEDRFVLATLTKWAHDPQFLRGDLSIVLVAENLAEMSPRLARNPYVSLIDLPLPDEAERLTFIETRLRGQDLARVTEIPPPTLARMTAGLSRVNLDRVLTEATDRGVRITQEVLKAKKKELIQAEAHGLLEFIEPPFNLDTVAGHAGAKKMLKATAAALKAGHQGVVPMGYLVSGPVGTGKTFMVTCFAGELGIPCVKFLNFRSQWQGVTEANLEKIFNLLKALWPVAVMIDEADTMLGNRSSGGDSGTSARVFGSIASFMGNTEYRGKILWFLLTARPDLLPIDLKRQGRAEEHLALFYPQEDAEREELFRTLCRKVKVEVDVPAFAPLLDERGRQFSGADIEAVLVRSRFRALLDGRTKVNADDLKAVLADFLPPSYPLEIELQNLLAVQECTSRELLPPVFRELRRDEISARVSELKALLREA